MELVTLPSRCSFHLPIQGSSSGAWGRFLRYHPRAIRYSGPGRYCLARLPSSWSRRDLGLSACSSIINGRSGATRIDQSVNAFLAQPFVNYNMAGGWFLTSSPIITANWNAPYGQKWTVPIGGGFGRVFKIDDQAYNASIQVYYNVIRPDNAADLNLRTSLALLFPK